MEESRSGEILSKAQDILSKEQIEERLLPELSEEQHHLLWTIGLLEEATTLGLISGHPCTIDYRTRLVIDCLRDRRFTSTADQICMAVRAIYEESPAVVEKLGEFVLILLNVQNGKALKFAQGKKVD